MSFVNAELANGTVVNSFGGASTGDVVSYGSTPVGRGGFELNIISKNLPATINGTKFTGHALDQMQLRGVLSPTAVLDVIKNPSATFPGNRPGTSVFIKDNLKVITNKIGDVMTVIRN
ncbi:DUF4258 domain-containing protein [Dyadobacter sp. Leaf189]|uniref:DUF4258 domain-containing protein n=1 Tax=Dyadobacter sp. Leaf189 TaxID=1736295 RepID=UPI0006FE46C0|nr:DUF4258 domain-containing protein [Dyadobacter sp. Leaf189]KQS24671.1 hypothetical protein ASG33_23190 [Dyadobacter sp. Leaf189]